MGAAILDLNDTQEGVLAVIFKYCDDNQLALLDLKDLKKVLQFVTEEVKGRSKRSKDSATAERGEGEM